MLCKGEINVNLPYHSNMALTYTGGVFTLPFLMPNLFTSILKLSPSFILHHFAD